MPTALNIALGAVVAVVFWTCLGFAVARHLVGRSLALPIAPALGWALHSATILPVLTLAGFSTLTVATLGVVVLIASVVVLMMQTARRDGVDLKPVPAWAYGGAALLAVTAAVAIVPGVGPDGVGFAAPIFDHSKIAMIDDMVRLGLPPGNPFFGESGPETSRLAYYYLWHFGAAELAIVTGISGWEADIALTWFTTFASVMLMAGLANWLGQRRSAVLWVLLLNAALSVRYVLASIFDSESISYWIFKATGFGGWLFQAAWVPQHIASASTVVLAIFFLVRLASHPGSMNFVCFALLAAAGFESSAWVGGVLFPVAAAIVGLALIIDLQPQRRMAFMALGVGAAVLAIGFAAPLIYDQVLAIANRDGGSPIALHPYEVLGTVFPDGLRRVLNLPAYWLVLLPLEFPAIYVTGAVAAWLFLRSRDLADEQRRPATGLALLAATSLCGAWLFVSTIGENNDFGWRAVLPAVMVLTVFAAVGISQWISQRALIVASAAIGLWLLGLPEGVATVHRNAVGRLDPDGKVFADTPGMWAAVRRHAASHERVANNSLFLQDVTPWPVNLSWALLANRRSCFAGRELTLAATSLPRARREQINAQFIRVFAGGASSEDIEDMAGRYNCRVVVVTAQDGAWRQDPFATSPLYRLVESNDRWRIYRVTVPEGAQLP